MKAVIYARVSSEEQAREGFSIPAQLKSLREYADRITRNFGDMGILEDLVERRVVVVHCVKDGVEWDKDSQAQQLVPGEPYFLSMKAEVLSSMEQHEQALRCMRKALKHHPDDAEMSHQYERIKAAKRSM